MPIKQNFCHTVVGNFIFYEFVGHRGAPFFYSFTGRSESREIVTWGDLQNPRHLRWLGDGIRIVPSHTTVERKILEIRRPGCI